MRIQNKTTAVLGSNHNATIVVVPETIELLRVRYWQRLQHHRINECENRRGGPDAQGKREHNSSREARRFPQYAQTKAQVLNEILNPVHSARDRKSTRLNSSHVAISYAVFCLKKKNKKYNK